MTASEENNDDNDRLMGEWMKVMLEELERKRDEHDEALAEDRLRSSDAPQKVDSTQRRTRQRGSAKGGSKKSGPAKRT